MAMMAQVAQYVDLRMTIDNNAPSYDSTKYQEELEETKHQLITEQHKAATLALEKSSTESDIVRILDFDSEPNSQDQTRESSRQESRQSLKNKSRQSSGAGKRSGTSPASKSPSRKLKSGAKQSAKTEDTKEYAEIAVQDEGGDHTKAIVDDREIRKGTSSKGRRSKSTLETVEEMEVLDFDLDDEASWSNIPKDQVYGQFGQYRKQCVRRIHSLEEQVQLMQAKTQRKVQTLKAQFLEHKNKWDAERKILVKQVGQASKMQTDAEKEADSAMTQLEEFINDQEKLDNEEQNLRKEMTIERTESRKDSDLQTTETESTEPDLKKLMQQTDDAKAQELTSRATTSGALSAPPAIEEVETIDGKKPSSSKSIEHPASFVNLKEFPPLEGAASGDHSPSLHSKTSSGSTGKDSLSRDSSVRISSIESNYEESGLQTGHSEARTRSDQKSGSLKSGSAKSGSIKSVSIKSGSAKSESEKLGTAKSGSAHSGSVKSGSVKSGCEGIEEKVNISDVDKSVCSNGSVAERISSLSSRRDLVSLRKESLPSSSSVKRNSLDVKSTSEKDGVTDVETSAHSRKSLTSQYKANLKSSAISVRSLDDELILDEDDLQDADFKASNDAGTSPPIENQFQKARQTPLVDHPVVVDFVKTYDGVVQFKDLLSKILLDKDMMTASQILSDIETLEFDRQMKVLPQVEGMTYNVTYILEEIANLLNNILVYDREPNVSSLMFLSRDPTKASLTRQKSSESGRGILATRGSFQSEISMNEQRNLMSDNKHLLQDIQEKYHILHQQFDEENRKHGEQLQHNTVVMMGMQDTINELQRELSTLGNKRRTRSGTPSQRMKKPPSPETSVMFTRLDSERNAKIMKRAVMDDRLPPETYKEAVSKMDDYVSIPAQRFGHLVRKYIHHCRMKAIEDNVRKSKSLDDDVFEVLDKMEALQNERARRWANSMDEMGAERLRLANILMDTLDSIEEESGLFLIKPMYSFRGRKIPEHYGSKLSRPVRPKHRPASHASTGAFAPAPTPSQAKLIKMDIKTQQQAQDFVVNMRPLGPLEGDPTGLTGSSLSWVGQAPNQTWSFSSSQSRTLKDDGLGSYNTPRILELDINRMLIGQNNVSTVLQQPMTSDRLVNASQNSLRSYVTVNRPMVQPSHSERQQPATAARVAPPSSPQGRSVGVADKVHMIEKDHNVPSTLQYPRTPPLPPITPTHSDTGTSNSHKEPPHSPPGSSLQTSPTTKEVSDFGIDGSAKVYTRDSSHLTLTSISAISEDE